MVATIIKEDGSVVAGANSYVTVAELTTFASNRGKTIAATNEEDLLIQAMDYIEQYNFKGCKLTQDQPLQWPRAWVEVDGYYLDSDVIPQLLKDALCQCAIAIDEDNDPLQDAPRQTIREQVDTLSVEYAPNASAVVINKKILHTIRKLLAGGSNSTRKA